MNAKLPYFYRTPPENSDSLYYEVYETDELILTCYNKGLAIGYDKARKKYFCAWNTRVATVKDAFGISLSGNYINIESWKYNVKIHYPSGRCYQESFDD